MPDLNSQWFVKFLEDKFEQNDNHHTEMFARLLEIQKEVAGIKGSSKVKMAILGLLGGSVGAAILTGLVALIS